jgi:catechol 2,3-dioxygenase-like lactoylglutathione lyase family enzyme
MWIVGLDHVQLAAPPGCEAEARRFFGELLGLSEMPKPPLLAARGGVWFSLGDQGLHIGVEDPFFPARKAHPALLVDSSALDPLARRLTDAGVEVVWDEDLAPIRRFYASDPWGNRVELIGASAPP